MKTLFRLIAVCAALGLSVAAGASAARFELRLDQKDGERLVAVVNLASGGGAVAAGRDRLDLLSDRDAQKTLARLRGEPDIEGEQRAERGGIVVHKMDYDESAGPEADLNERRVRRGDRSAGRGGDGIPAGGEDRKQDAERRIIYIRGADAAEAVKFIDDIAGLDDDERAAIKSAAGL